MAVQPTSEPRRLETAFFSAIVGTLLGVVIISAPSLVAVLILTSLFIIVIRHAAIQMEVPVLWSMMAFLLPLLVAIVDWQFRFMPQFPDANLYDHLGWATVEAWQNGVFFAAEDYLNLRVRTYAIFVAVVYSVFGHNILAPITINAGIWGLTTVYWMWIWKEVFNMKKYWLPGLLFVFYPGGILYTSAVLREALSIFFMTITVVTLQDWMRSEKQRPLVFALLFSALTGLFRPELVPALWIGPAGALVLGNWNIRYFEQVGLLLLSGVSVFGLASLLHLSLPRYLSPSYFLDLGTLEKLRHAHAQRPHAYLIGMEYSSWLDVLLSLPFRVFFFLFSPFPWIPAIFDLTIASVDGVFIFAIVMMIMIAFFNHQIPLRRGTFALALTALLLLVGYSLVISTPSAARRRLYVVPILILFASCAGRNVMIRW